MANHFPSSSALCCTPSPLTASFSHNVSDARQGLSELLVSTAGSKIALQHVARCVRLNTFRTRCVVLNSDTSCSEQENSLQTVTDCQAAASVANSKIRRELYEYKLEKTDVKLKKSS